MVGRNPRRGSEMHTSSPVYASGMKRKSEPGLGLFAAAAAVGGVAGAITLANGFEKAAAISSAVLLVTSTVIGMAAWAETSKSTDAVVQIGSKIKRITSRREYSILLLGLFFGYGIFAAIAAF